MLRRGGVSDIWWCTVSETSAWRDRDPGLTEMYFLSTGILTDDAEQVCTAER
jgi:hypothetical protein